MNSSYRASDAPEAERKLDTILSLTTVQRMLPLVQRIVDDFLAAQQALHGLLPEEEQLDRCRRSLTWPQRQRRYQVKDELASVQRHQDSAREELANLGVALLDGNLGRVGFPTLVNNRRAFFSWQHGEDGLHTWHFAEEETFRPIPAAWMKEISHSGKP